MDITHTIQNDPYEDYFNKIMKLHCDAISTKNKYFPSLNKAELRFKIDTMDKFYLVVYLENLDSNGLTPFNRGKVPADFVFIEIDNLKVPSRYQLQRQLSQHYGLSLSTFDSLVDMDNNAVYDLIHLIERQFMHKCYAPNRMPYTPSNPDPSDYRRSKYYLTLYREDVFELYRRLKLLVETL